MKDKGKEEGSEEEHEAKLEEIEEELEAKLVVMHKLVKELEASLAKKAKAKAEEKADSVVEFSSPPPKLKKGGSFESLSSGGSFESLSTDDDFVKESWTPSPGPKQLTLAASLKKTGQDAQIIKVCSPGAKKQESLKDVLLKQVCKGPKIYIIDLRNYLTTHNIH